MVNVYVRRRIPDYTAWKQIFDGFAAKRRAGGEQTYKIARVVGEPNNLCLSFEWDNVANAQRFLASPELASAMQQAGVAEKPDIHIAEEVASGKP
ncbi:MAG: antibiotic biosynthesis monooxygenase [Candidatus Binatia bacterium]